VELENVETLVNVEPVVDVVQRRADDAGEEANEGSKPDVDITGSRSDTDETGNGSLAGSGHGELALIADHVDEDPPENTSAGSSVGVEDDVERADGGVESGATVEPKPTKPDQNGPEPDERGVVRLRAPLTNLRLDLALPKDESVGEGSAARRDVDRSTTSEVQLP
jgi:hypothetical protein